MSSLQERYNEVLGEVAAVAEACGRPAPVVVVVSKNRTPEEIRAAYDAGARDFGENRAQGFQEHRDALGDLGDIRWHFIGHLQTNKVSKVVGQASLVHSVDSIRLLESLDNRARRTKAPPVPVLLQVNVSGEAQKHGFEPAGLDAALRFAERLAHVEIRGLMTMGPLDASEDTQDEVFGRLREVHEDLLTHSEGRYHGDQLSMGMSQDYRSAIRHGATMVRIGTAIFQSQGGT